VPFSAGVVPRRRRVNCTPMEPLYIVHRSGRRYAPAGHPGSSAEGKRLVTPETVGCRARARVGVGSGGKSATRHAGTLGVPCRTTLSTAGCVEVFFCHVPAAQLHSPHDDVVLK